MPKMSWEDKNSYEWVDGFQEAVRELERVRSSVTKAIDDV